LCPKIAKGYSKCLFAAFRAVKLFDLLYFYMSDRTGVRRLINTPAWRSKDFHSQAAFYVRRIEKNYV